MHQVTHNARNAQRGYTLLEIAIATVIVLVTLAAAVAKFGGQQDASRSAEAQKFFMSDLPTALASYRASHGASSQITTKDDIKSYGVPTNTAWGDSWSVSKSGTATDGITINYPIGGNHPSEIASNIATFLTSTNADNERKFPFVQSATASNSKLTVKIRSL